MTFIADAAVDTTPVRMDASAIADGIDRDVAIDASTDDDDDGRRLVILPAQFVEENQPLRMLEDGGPIDLWTAPQGGHVVLVAAKVRNLIGDTGFLSVRARYPDTPFIVAQEARSVKFVPVPGEPGTMQPDLQTRTQVAHVPLCPDYDPMDIVDRPLEFRLQLEATWGETEQTGETTLQLRPSCRASAGGEAFCKCECSANYVLGKCPRDAGRD